MIARIRPCLAARSLALGLFLTAAAAFAEGGVGVGNGRMAYNSPFGFSVEYREELTLQVASQREFEISNRGLVRKEEPISRVSFLVDERPVKNLEELSELLKSENPGLVLRPMRLVGAEGYFSEDRTEDSLRGEYFLRTEKNTLIRVQLVADAAGNGLSWVAPIVRTFTYDETAPVILGLSAAGSRWESGTVQAILLRARETNSGVNKRMSYLGFQRYDEAGNKLEGNFFLGTHRANWVQEDEENHRIEIKVPGFLPPGRYLLNSFSASDLANNSTRIEARDPGLAHYSGSGMKGRPAIPLLWVHITNSGLVDTMPPEIVALRVDSSEWIAGQTHKVHFQVKEEGAGLALETLDCGGIRTYPFVPENAAYSGRCENPRHEGGDWYSAEVALDPYLPEGEYVLMTVSAEDRAGNSFLGIEDKSNQWYQSRGEDTKLPLLKVRVRNTGKVDVTDPVLHEWRLDATVWKAGSTQKLYFRAEDENAGVREFRGAAPHGWLEPTEDKGGDLYRTIYIDRDIVSLGNGWFYAVIEVSPFIRGGDFYIQHFSVADGAGNADTVRCSPDAGCKNKRGKSLPFLRVTVER